MNTNLISKTAVLITVMAVAVVTISFTAPPKASLRNDDFSLRHPGGLISVLRPAWYLNGSDYFMRHAGRLAAPALTLVVNYAGSASARNDPEFAPKAGGTDTSDYFLRHPEWMSRSAVTLVVNYAGSASARNDPEFTPKTGAIDTSDYFLRHPELGAR